MSVYVDPVGGRAGSIAVRHVDRCSGLSFQRLGVQLLLLYKCRTPSGYGRAVAQRTRLQSHLQICNPSQAPESQSVTDLLHCSTFYSSSQGLIIHYKQESSCFSNFLYHARLLHVVTSANARVRM